LSNAEVAAPVCVDWRSISGCNYR